MVMPKMTTLDDFISDPMLGMLKTQQEREIWIINKILGDVQSDKTDEKSHDSPLITWRLIDPTTQQEQSGSRKIHCSEKIQEQKRRLPIFQYKLQFLHAVWQNQVVVVVGETGSGKSTQMPQYLMESGMIAGKIAVTEPRRVAAVSVAGRVAEEIGCTIGDLVGYGIRFEDVSSPTTVLKYMTDGLLLTECLRDPLFSSYGCIILDEAHERTLHTDVLLGLLKKALRKRPELKLIITSATLDIRKFSEYFDAPMVKIPGKMFPVQVKYLPETFRIGRKKKDRLSPLWSRTNRSEFFIKIAVDKVLSIHNGESTKKGDILLFLPGKEEVEQACSMIQEQNVHRDMLPMPVYAALPFEAQCNIFRHSEEGVRKIVVATNIAETSLTLDGIFFVVDSGFYKESIYDRGIDTLKVSVISKAQAEQRAGRAGRTAPGLCYRLYTSSDYEKMKPVPDPAIHRIDLTSTILQLKAMGIDDICGFGFMDPPKLERVRYSLERLIDLGALTSNFTVTSLGNKMAEFPLSPNLAKVLLTAAEMGCSHEVLTIVSMLSVNYIFVRPKRRQLEADNRKRHFEDPKGDHMTLLHVFDAWTNSSFSEEWSRKNFVHHKELQKALDIRTQLQMLMMNSKVPIISADKKSWSDVRCAFSSGYPNNVAYRDRDSPMKNAYRTLIDKKQVFIHPSSSLYQVDPEFVIYHETMTTSRTFMRIVSVCDKSWIKKNVTIGVAES